MSNQSTISLHKERSLFNPLNMDAFVQMTQEAKGLWIPLSIDECQEIDPLTFYREYVGRNIPLIIRGGCLHWPCLKKWTREFLQSTLKEPVTVALTPDGHGDCIIDGQFVLPFEREMTIQDFYKVQDHVPYIQKQCSSLLLEYPLLVQDAPPLEWAQQAFGMEPDAVNFWMGDSRAVSSTHRDPYENIYCVVKGIKQFTLLPPTDTPFLNRKMHPVAAYDQHMNIVPQSGQVPWITADPDDPSLCFASPFSITLYPGDVLYLPSMWYHKVKQQETSDKVIAVNFWYDMRFDARYTWLMYQDQVCLSNT